MGKNVELKPGIVVEADGKSYLLKSVRTLGFTAIDLDGIPISCNKCSGKLEKLGRVKGQFKCVDCGSPNYRDEKGNVV